MLIRRAQSQDIPEILRLLEQVLAVHVEGRPDLFQAGSTKYTPQELEEILVKQVVWVAQDDGAVPGDTLTGYLIGWLEKTPDSPQLIPHTSFFVDDLCVDEAARGKHVGQALMEAALAYARNKDCYTITLHCWNLNDHAAGFYEHLGMKPQVTTYELRV